MESSMLFLFCPQESLHSPSFRAPFTPFVFIQCCNMLHTASEPFLVPSRSNYKFRCVALWASSLTIPKRGKEVLRLTSYSPKIFLLFRLQNKEVIAEEYSRTRELVSLGNPNPIPFLHQQCYWHTAGACILQNLCDSSTHLRWSGVFPDYVLSWDSSVQCSTCRRGLFHASRHVRAGESIVFETDGHHGVRPGCCRINNRCRLRFV